MCDSYLFDDLLLAMKNSQQNIHAFSTLQPNLQYFSTGDGYIAYRKTAFSRLVLGPPVSPDPGAAERLIDGFLQKHPSSVFVQVCSETAAMLASRGFYTSAIGVENRVSLRCWSLAGRRKQSLRTAINQASASGISIIESSNHVDVQHVSASWLKTRRAKKEINFLIRPSSMPYQDGVRRFYAYRDGKPIAFVYFDPVFHHHSIVGFVPNISRSCPTFNQGAWYAIMAHAIQVFQSEGFEFVDLGLSPLAPTEHALSRSESPSLLALSRIIYRYGGRFYNFHGIDFAKTRFQPDRKPVFLAHRSALPLLSVFSIFRESRLI